ncbi:hypothetical protein C2G38_2172599 [Gigaspora rosea]|uniref:Uncharacterized protein n=1 Tax=Gigaspora rosea TaxID=44941 RepID=A0A397VM86_9GLOM|nr:hypothetical protein C2G38_2172599 [Gigaspora rosea]
MNVQNLLSDDPQSDEDYGYTDLDDLQNSNDDVNIENSISNSQIPKKSSLPKTFKSHTRP